MPKSEPSPTSSNWKNVDPGEQGTRCNLLTSGLHLTAWPLCVTASPWAGVSTEHLTLHLVSLQEGLLF